MQIARYELDGEAHHGALDGDRLKRLSGSPFDERRFTGQVDALSRAKLLCPVDPARIFGAGLNYISHIEEMKLQRPTQPLLFMKPGTTVVGPDEPIVYPRDSTDVHFEGELAVVVGRRARRLTSRNALDVVLGYTCANDVSERTIQRVEMAMGHLLIGKSFDTFCPLGPVIATGLDPTDLLLETHVNGQRRQSVRTSDLLFPVVDLLVYISHAVTLMPGDVILTGTPFGIGPIVPGDVVDVTVEGIGTLHNPVVAESAV
jgi:2-keto-4-pentenoate hydratase/2-oxohepta-3-ene-1,7-dioic acid hydratase in catechol pathway